MPIYTKTAQTPANTPHNAILHGDCIAVKRDFDRASVDFKLTDPGLFIAELHQMRKVLGEASMEIIDEPSMAMSERFHTPKLLSLREPPPSVQCSLITIFGEGKLNGGAVRLSVRRISAG